MGRNRFYAIYFIDHLTGSLLISNKYSNKSKICNTDEDLISSFLNAINLFINELNQNKNQNPQYQNDTTRHRKSHRYSDWDF